MTVDRAGIRAFFEIPEDSWHLFPLFFMVLTMELNHRFELYLQRATPYFIVKVVTLNLTQLVQES